MTRLLLLVEGQTEEAFVNRVLKPRLQPQGIFPTATLLRTKEMPAGQPYKGGVTSFERMARDVRRLLAASDARVSTLIDYYGLPPDFPGLDAALQSPDAAARVCALEDAFATVIDHPRFRPFLVLHEFEAWIFAVPTEAAAHFSLPSLVPVLKRATDSAGGPERVNDGQNTHPSQRLADLLRQHGQTYGKVLDGPGILAKAGLDPIRATCPHFAAWLAWLEQLRDGSSRT